MDETEGVMVSGLLPQAKRTPNILIKTSLFMIAVNVQNSNLIWGLKWIHAIQESKKPIDLQMINQEASDENHLKK